MSAVSKPSCDGRVRLVVFSTDALRRDEPRRRESAIVTALKLQALLDTGVQRIPLHSGPAALSAVMHVGSSTIRVHSVASDLPGAWHVRATNTREIIPLWSRRATRDGRFLLPIGSTATLYLDDEGDVVERNELRPVRAARDASPTCEPQAAKPTELLDHTIRQAYALDPVAVSDPLEALLAPTGVCKLAHRDVAGNARFLAENASGYFLLVGDHGGFESVGPDEVDLSVPDGGERRERARSLPPRLAEGIGHAAGRPPSEMLLTARG